MQDFNFNKHTLINKHTIEAISKKSKPVKVEENEKGIKTILNKKRKPDYTEIKMNIKA